MANRNYPRIDEIIKGKETKGCYRIITPLAEVDGSPAKYARKHTQSWLDSSYGLAQSFLTPQRAQFVDIETRGLSPTNQIWLVGSAHLNADGLVIEQLLARDPLEEGAIIREFFDLTRKRPDWISFNGETFDESRLLARAKAHLLQGNPAEKHIDVYSLYRADAKKRKLQRVTLRELERVVFPDFKRQNHIEGRDIPAAYQDYIDNGDPLPLRNAINHNTYDLVTLAALYLKRLEEGL